MDAVGKALKGLENEGYMERRQLRGKDGRIMDTEYTIYEQPRNPMGTPFPDMDLPETEDPDQRCPIESSLPRRASDRKQLLPARI